MGNGIVDVIDKLLRTTLLAQKILAVKILIVIIFFRLSIFGHISFLDKSCGQIYFWTLF